MARPSASQLRGFAPRRAALFALVAALVGFGAAVALTYPAGRSDAEPVETAPPLAPSTARSLPSAPPTVSAPAAEGQPTASAAASVAASAAPIVAPKPSAPPISAPKPRAAPPPPPADDRPDFDL